MQSLSYYNLKKKSIKKGTILVAGFFNQIFYCDNQTISSSYSLLNKSSESVSSSSSDSDIHDF